MSFNYDKYKSHGQNESFWTSYSDLFLGLSSIFLLLYVVASLRNGTDSIKMQSDNNRLKVEVQDLKNQLQTYENVKDNYLKTQAEKSELDEYQELMDKLTLLQDDAKTEKDKLRKQARLNEEKEAALNKYQQMVRNVINSNKFAKVKISNRNEVIQEQDVEITDKSNEIKRQEGQIANLNQDIVEKEHEIKQRENQIAAVNSQLDNRMKQLKNAYKHAKMTQKAYNEQMKKMQAEAQRQVASLAEANRATMGELSNAKQQLAQTQANEKRLAGAVEGLSGKLKDTEGKLQATSGELENTKGQLNATTGQLKNTQGQLQATSGQLKNAQGQLENTKGQLNAAYGQLKNTEGQLAAAKAELEARRGIAKEIEKGFRAAGVKAEIDAETGDVQLDFGSAHFDNDSASLKAEMKRILQNAMPSYSKSLFGNPKVAGKISAVEIIGFASPTYKGRFVDTASNRPEDRQALKYNMDLSYKRANSIFNYILDEKEMNFNYRNALIPTLKVSGRSFLDLVKADRSVASVEEYCAKNDCKKKQKVIIRFSLDKK